jgi:hypothetical protein
MDPIEPKDQPHGYIVPDSKTAERILAIQAELLESGGLDPAWPGFGRAARRIQTDRDDPGD